MCKTEYVNLQTGEKLDLERVESLPDNAMLKVRPDLWCEWDFEKNVGLGLDIWKVTKGMNKKVWWICQLEHSSSTSINNRKKSKVDFGCKICSNLEKLVGFNDMWATNPELAKLLANPEDGHKYSESSGEYVDWKCLHCGDNIKNKRIADVNKRGLKCPKCSDGVKYPEKFMYVMLSTIITDFKMGFITKWSNKKRYDFYIPALNAIVETHGGQHYNGGFKTLGGKTIKEEENNDRYKRELALQNGIEHYIEIDCRKSDMEYMRNSILNSKLAEVLDLSSVDWNEVALRSEKSLVVEVCNFYNVATKDIVEISKKYKLCSATIRKYLKKGSIIGLCDYTKEKSFKIRANKLKRKIIQINEKSNTVNGYESLLEASKYITFDKTGISKCLNGHQQTAGGYKWMYKEDYEQYIEEQNNTYNETV